MTKPRRSAPKKKRPQALTGEREAVVQRLWRTAERQVADIEQRLMAADQEPAERERDTRMMAVLVKTLVELGALDDAKPKKSGARGAAKSSPVAPEQHDNASDESRSLDEFRRELARRIAALAGDEPAETDNGTAGDGP